VATPFAARHVPESLILLTTTSVVVRARVVDDSPAKIQRAKVRVVRRIRGEITGTPAAPVFNVDITPRVRPGGAWTQPGGDALPQQCLAGVVPGYTCPVTLRKIEASDAFDPSWSEKERKNWLDGFRELFKMISNLETGEAQEIEAQASGAVPRNKLLRRVE
jgi:hypothetical protein